MKNYQDVMFKLVKGPNIDSKDVEEGRCMRESYKKLCLSEKERGKVRRRVTNKENVWDRNVEVVAVERSVVWVGREEALQALNEMKTGKASRPPDVSLELIAAREEEGI